MKKIIAILLLISLSLSLFACEAFDSFYETFPATAEQTTPTETPPTETTPTETTPTETTPTETTPTITTPDVTTPEETTPEVPSVGGEELSLGDEEITIVFYHTMGKSLREILDKYIVEFNKLYPNITVEHTQVGGYDDVRNQIQTEIILGSQPNIAYCYPDHVALYNIAKAVQTLDSYIESIDFITRADGTTETIGLSQEQIDNFIDAFYEEGRAYGNDTMYTLPMSKSTEVLYYNKTFFEANNLKVPTTWDELEAVCAKIKAIDPTCIPLGYDSESNWFITMCEQLGSPYTSATKGEEFLFNNQTNRDFVARFRSWYEKGYVTTREISGDYTSALFTKDSSETGNCYMCISYTSGANHQTPKDVDGSFKFEVGIAPIPQVDSKNPKVISQGPSLCIFKNANQNKVLASWLFVKFLTTNLDFQAEFALASGYMPVLENVTDNPIYAAELDLANGYEGLALLAARVALNQADAYYTTPTFNGSSAARDEVAKLLQFCLIDPSCATPEGILAAFEDAVAACKYQIGSN